MNIREAYRVLELAYGEPPEAIEAAFVKLIRVWHPDRFAHAPDLRDDAAQKSVQLNSARELLQKAWSTGSLNDPNRPDRSTINELVDDQVRYRGADPRLPKMSFWEWSGTPAIVSLSAQELTIGLISDGKLITAQTYLIEELKRVRTDRAWWTQQGRESSVDSEMALLSAVDVSLEFVDPAGILSHLCVCIRFRNDYFKRLFINALLLAAEFKTDEYRPPPPGARATPKPQPEESHKSETVSHTPVVPDPLMRSPGSLATTSPATPPTMFQQCLIAFVGLSAAMLLLIGMYAAIASSPKPSMAEQPVAVSPEREAKAQITRDQAVSQSPNSALNRQPARPEIRPTSRDVSMVRSTFGTGVANREWHHEIEQWTAKIAADPFNAWNYTNRGVVWQRMGEYEKALADFRHSLRISPLNGHTCNNIAWLLATCPDAQFRDGKQALDYAKKACTLVADPNSNFMGTLAAAYAEAGDFEAAIRLQVGSMNGATGSDRDEKAKRLELYRAHRPYRDAPVVRQ